MLALNTWLVDVNLNLILTLLLFVTFYFILVFFAKKYGKRLSLNVEGGFVLLRTERFNRKIESIGRKYKRLFSLFGFICIAICAYLLALGIQVMHDNLYKLIIRSKQASPVIVLIPGVTLGWDILPYFIIAIGITIITHELAHGFVAASEGIDIKSSGLVYFLIFFGAFVEFKNEQFEKSRLITKLKVLAAGSATNYVIALLVLLLLYSTLVPVPGVLIEDTIKGFPAHGVLNSGDIIVAINGTPIKTLDDLNSFMKHTKPGDIIFIKILRAGKYEVVKLQLSENPQNPGRGFMGVKIMQCETFRYNIFPKPWNYILAYYYYRFLNWIMFICSSVAVVNILPIYPLDGGKILLYLLKAKFRKGKIAENICIIVSLYFVAIVTLNIVFSFRLLGARAWLP